MSMGASSGFILLWVRVGLWMVLTLLSGCTDAEVLGPGVRDSGRADSSQGPPVPAHERGRESTGGDRWQAPGRGTAWSRLTRAIPRHAPRCHINQGAY